MGNLADRGIGGLGDREIDGLLEDGRVCTVLGMKGVGNVGTWVEGGGRERGMRGMCEYFE